MKSLTWLHCLLIFQSMCSCFSQQMKGDSSPSWFVIIHRLYTSHGATTSEAEFGRHRLVAAAVQKASFGDKPSTDVGKYVDLRAEEDILLPSISSRTLNKKPITLASCSICAPCLMLHCYKIFMDFQGKIGH